KSAPRALRRLVLIMQCKARGEESSLHEGLPAAAAVDASALAASYVPLQVYAWILPVLGFIGTAIGMAHAIGKFSEALRPAAGQIEVTTALSQGVIPGLSTAFETTILALATASIFCSFRAAAFARAIASNRSAKSTPMTRPCGPTTFPAGMA